MNFLNSLASSAVVTFALVITTFTAPHSAVADIAEADFANAMKKFLQTDDGQDSVSSAVKTSITREERVKQAKAEEDLFKNRKQVDIGGSPVMGPANAPITIVEFSDFECPYCSRGRLLMDALFKTPQFKDKIKLVFKHFPLTQMHENALPAAKASLAAGKQSKFWEFHDELFANQNKLSEPFFLEIAQKLKLDVDKFKLDMNSSEVSAQIDQDKQEALKAGVQGTPMFLINGVVIKGALPLTELIPIVERLLKEGK
jgi:protein-disulfide isomerase